MWLAASILEAEAMHLPLIEAGEGEEAEEAVVVIKATVSVTADASSDYGETGHGETSPAEMAHGEWLAHMAAAEYGEMPDHMPSVW